MDPLFMAFEGDSAIISEIFHLAKTSGAEHSEPVPLRSMADALDAPIGAEEIKAALTVVSAGFGTASAALVFVDKVMVLIKKHRKPVVVRDPENGRKIGQLDADSKPEEVHKMLGL